MDDVIGHKAQRIVNSIVMGHCRQEVTWKELQPILLPVSPTPQAEAATKPKRKLQPAETHMRGTKAKPAATKPADTDALPSVASAPASRKSAKPAQAGRMSAKAANRSQQLSDGDEDEQAVLAEEPTRGDTHAGLRADAGNCPAAKDAAACAPCSASKQPRVMIALGSMHTRQQQAYSKKLIKIGVACVSHTQCPR